MNRIIAVNGVRLSEEHCKKIQAAATGFELLTGEKAKERIAECEILFGHISQEMLAGAKNLKWLHTASAGVEHVLAPKMAFPDSIVLTNSAGMHGLAIAEHMLAFTLMLMRGMQNYVRQQDQHKWEFLGPVKSVYESKITVVGLGGIGSQYASRVRALGAKVTGVVRSPRAETPDCVDALFTIDRLDEAIADADLVALSLPSTSETVQLFDKNQMLKMKKGVIIINIGRGSAIDQDALIELLENGHIGGAGLDVTSPEPLPADSKLWDFPNVLITPHASHGALSLTTDMIVDRFVGYLKDYIAGKPFERVVDRKAGY